MKIAFSTAVAALSLACACSPVPETPVFTGLKERREARKKAREEAREERERASAKAWKEHWNGLIKKSFENALAKKREELSKPIEPIKPIEPYKFTPLPELEVQIPKVAPRRYAVNPRVEYYSNNNYDDYSDDYYVDETEEIIAEMRRARLQAERDAEAIRSELRWQADMNRAYQGMRDLERAGELRRLERRNGGIHDHSRFHRNP